MLISKTATMKWNSKNKRHYTDLGYAYTRMGDTFTVATTHLTKGSNVIVHVRCDYCGKIMERKWCIYLAEHNTRIDKDCCDQCKKLKIVETCIVQYGVNSVFGDPATRERIAKTNIERYGVANLFDSSDMQNRIRAERFERYGVIAPAQRPEVLAKIRNTCRARYGVDYYIETQRLSGEDSPVWKGGVARQRSERLTYEYRKWRNDVFARDRYTCVC